MTTDDQQGSTQAARVVQITGPLSERLARAVETLATLTAEVDGVGPLDDDARLGLRQAHQPARRHLLATRPAPGSAASSAAS